VERERFIMSKYDRNAIGRRGFAIASLFLAGFVTSGCATKWTTKPPKILFVCQAGTAKSPIAREIFRRRAKERGIAVKVFSRGIVLEDHASPELKQRLRADGIDTSAEPAMPLAPADWAAADILVNFNPLPTSVEHNDVRDWSDVPSVNDDYENARAVLDKRIDALLTELAAGKR
jgi:protein-tyrosine-phosphatase